MQLMMLWSRFPILWGESPLSLSWISPLTSPFVFVYFCLFRHLHVGGIDLTFYDDATGELICKSEAIYGNGTEAGNEKNYIVGMTPCVFDDPPVFRKNDKVRVVSRYNATEPHFGVMALFLNTFSDVVA